MSGYLITLEGIDGSGKSTAAGHIAGMLGELAGRRIVLTAEPTAGEAGRILRCEMARSGDWNAQSTAAEGMEELFLFMADHADHLARTVIPSLEDGAVVLSDRYSDSTAAYQGVTLSKVITDPVSWIQNIFRPWDRIPDRTLLFLLDPEEALKRMRSRPGRDKFERLDFLKAVDENFRRMAFMEPDRFVLIDASQDVRSVAAEAMAALLNHIG
ncbi:MAG: dTMP kinase [Methanothrix sp.]|nr:dTMP kinase [Methanothrix sp.]